MSAQQKTRIILGASSAIGGALAQHWMAQGHRVVGTFRRDTASLAPLRPKGITLTRCDFADADDVARAATEINEAGKGWSVAAFLPGTMMPISPFEACDFAAWRESLEVNFLNQMQMLSGLLESRARGQGDVLVLLFAGGGVNSAPRNLSAYTISKIATIKMCEMLHAEIADVRSVAIGPGWVDTPIHQEMFDAGPAVGEVYSRTVERFESGGFVAMEEVISFCDWVENQSRSVVGGRNFSVLNDSWQDSALGEILRRDEDMFRLRRCGNAWRPPSAPGDKNQ